MKKHRLRTFQILIAGAIAFSALYLFSIRFTSFLSASRPEKIVSLLAVLIISFPFTLIIFRTFVSRMPDPLSKPKQISIFLITLFFSGWLNFFLLPSIQFPEAHSLEIEAIPGIDSGGLKILSIEELDIRSMMQSSISRESLHLPDAWKIDPKNGELSWNGDSDAPLIYSRFMQAGLHVQFAAGPKGGEAQITWDGQEQIIDLFSPVEKTVVLTLAPAFNYRSAIHTQKALVGAAYFAQWTLMANFLYWSITALIAMPAERAHTLILAVVILLTLFPLVSSLNPPISFPDPGLEAAIRDAVDQPWGRLRQQKLLTIASLDLANTGIYDLEGFQHLTNVSELSLRDNNIADISPLRDIISLRELNLRGNKIEDISPIANLSSLENLNLRDNPINDLSPLEYLHNLHTLNLHGIPIQNLEILANFPQLSRLNLRDCGITNVTVLAELMREGAMQDDPLHLVRAELDIRDNPIPRKDADGYAPVRPYWENIYDRAPFVLPPQTGITAPIFSHAAGFYEDVFSLTLTTPVQDAVIYYTLDGSEPGKDSEVYRQPIRISQPVSTNEDISQITTTSPQWEDTAAPIFKGAVVRAVAILQDGGQSPITTAVYFVAPDIENRYTLPVVSIIADPTHLFSPDQGIYVIGRALKNYDGNIDYRDANYYKRGGQWERPVHVEIFSTSGESMLSQNAGMRIHGASIRHYPQKSLRLYADDWYGDVDRFTTDILSGQVSSVKNKSTTQYKNLLLRNTGNNRNYPHFRDALMHYLLADFTVDTAAYRPVNVFINGEYWGIHALREHLNEQYISTHYDLPLEDIAILERNAQLYFGVEGDQGNYLDLLEFIRINNISQPDIYRAVSAQIDIDNYLDYTIAEIYSANKNWPHDNIKYWRSRSESLDPDAPFGADGRWRWMLFDLDNAFGYGGEGFGYQSDSIAQAEGEFLFRTLLLNPQFKYAFINRTADLLNTAFSADNVTSVIESLNDELKPDLPEYFSRWNLVDGDMNVWEQNIDIGREFAANRPDHLRKLVVDRFQLAGTAEIIIRADPECGTVRVNSIIIAEDTPGVPDPSDWSGIYFKGIPLTIEAIPLNGCQFSSWEGIDSAESSISVTLDSLLTIKAVFAPVQ